MNVVILLYFFQLNIWDFTTQIPLLHLPTCTIFVNISNRLETIGKLWVIINLKGQEGSEQDVNIFKCSILVVLRASVFNFQAECITSFSTSTFKWEPESE